MIIIKSTLPEKKFFCLAQKGSLIQAKYVARVTFSSSLGFALSVIIINSKVSRTKMGTIEGTKKVQDIIKRPKIPDWNW